MASYLLRRSGISVGLVCEVLDWQADLMIQVGVGNYHQEVDVLKSEWSGVKFIGYEPHPRVCKRLKKTYPGPVHPIALSNKTGKYDLNIKARHSDGSSLLDLHDGSRLETVKVDVDTLDNVCPADIHSYRRILLWLDCEGSELDVLEGGEETIHKHISMINLEMTAAPPSAGWGHPVEIHKWMVDRGWFLQWIHTQRISLGQCDFIYVKNWLFNPNYCCVPSEIERYECSL